MDPAIKNGDKTQDYRWQMIATTLTACLELFNGSISD